MGLTSLKIKPDLHDLIFTLACILDGISERCRWNDPSTRQDLTHIEFIRACIYGVSRITFYSGIVGKSDL